MAYFANNSEQDTLTDQCRDCPLGCGWTNTLQQVLFDKETELRSCPVSYIQIIYNYDQLKNEKLESAMGMLVDDNGICQIRRILSENRKEEIPDWRDDGH